MKSSKSFIIVYNLIGKKILIYKQLDFKI